jgi:hypothetical protein
MGQPDVEKTGEKSSVQKASELKSDSEEAASSSPPASPPPRKPGILKKTSHTSIQLPTR